MTSLDWRARKADLADRAPTEVVADVLAKLATLLASFGTLEPAMAAWLPDGMMAAISLWAFARLR